MPDINPMSVPYVVKRSITLATSNGDRQLSDLRAALSAQQGVIDVSADARRKRLRLRYDVKQLLFDDIVQLLASQDMALSTHWWMRLKGGWYRLLDSNARENANLKAGPCCSNPTEIYTRRNWRG